MISLPIFVVGILVAFVAKFLQFLKRRQEINKLVENIPGPKGLPLIGVAHEAFGGNGAFEYIVNSTGKYGSPTKFWFGPFELVVVIEDPDDMKIVLNSESCLDKPPSYNLTRLEKGLFCAEKTLWKVHRRIVQPAFTLNVLHTFLPTFDKTAAILMKNLDGKVNQPEFDCYDYIAACSLETIFETMLNLEYDVQSKPINNIVIQEAEMGSRIYTERMTKVIYHFEPIFRMTSLYQLEKKCTNGSLADIDDIVIGKKNLMRIKEATYDNYKKPEKFIDLLMKPENMLKYDEVQTEVRTIILAGLKTTSAAISACLLMIAMHPNVQEKIFTELGEVFGESKLKVDQYTLTKLVYLEMVVKETLRLFPIGAITGRFTSDDVKLENHTIPKGTNILLNILKLQRNPKYWGNDAESFIPERFEPDRIKDVHPYAFIPFLNGARMCLGFRYAMLFSKTILAHILFEYKLKTTLEMEKLDLDLPFTLRVKQGYKITMEKREK